MSHSASVTPLFVPRPRRPAVFRIVGALGAVLASARRALLLRRERRLLERLDDRTLADLGLHRDGADGAVRFGRGEPSAAEAEWSLWHLGPRR